MTSLRHVINLRLSANQVTAIADGSFRPTGGSVQILDLSSNLLSTATQQTFVGVETVLHLDLSANRLKSVDGAFASMKDLTRLDLRNNRLVELSASTFRGLSSLRYLLLSSNEISSVDRRAFRALERLVYLLLKDNPIGTHVVRFQFHSPSLSYLDISECGFMEVRERV